MNTPGGFKYFLVWDAYLVDTYINADDMQLFYWCILYYGRKRSSIAYISRPIVIIYSIKYTTEIVVASRATRALLWKRSLAFPTRFSNSDTSTLAWVEYICLTAAEVLTSSRAPAQFVWGARVRFIFGNALQLQVSLTKDYLVNSTTADDSSTVNGWTRPGKANGSPHWARK